MNKNTSGILSPVFTARPMLGRQTGMSLCISTSSYLFFGGGWTKQTRSSALPLLPSSALRASLVLIGGSAGLQWGS